MSRVLHKISPHNLLPGMYIEQLDRPWLETPLPFQGFCIRTERDIQWIKDCCAYVFVDSGKSDKALEFDYSNPPPPKSNLLQECAREMVAPVAVGKPATSASHVGPSNSSALHEFAPVSPADPEIVRPSLLSRMFGRKAEEPKTDQAVLKEQVASANQTYQRAQKIISSVLSELRAGGELDVSAVEKVICPVIDCVLQSTDAMACVMRMKEADDYTYNHSLATSIWSVVFGKALGFDRRNLEILGVGGLLLDIGKTRLSPLLLKKTDALEPQELLELRRHVDYGLAILKQTDNIDPKIMQMLETHHERHDGSGYPHGLAGNEIPVFGRIAGLVDTYDAMTSMRPYASAMSTYNVMRMLIDRADVLFQSELVERFIQVVGIFPTASLIELNSGEVGIVVEQNPLRRLKPKIMLVLDKDKELRNDFPVIDLSEINTESDEAQGVWIVHGLEPGSFGIDPREYYL